MEYQQGPDVSIQKHGIFGALTTTSLVVLIALVCIPVILALFLENAPAKASVENTLLITPSFVIQYTAEGFSPRTLEVPLGARVIFKNTTSIPMRVASDPYPAHTDYAEFDAGRDFFSGETYSFQFERGGTFGYHNDERPVDAGTVRVFDPLRPVPDISKTLMRHRAARDALLTLLVPGDPDSIFKVIDAIQADPSLPLDCHEVAHDLGHKAYELYGFSGAMTYNSPDNVNHASVMDICAGGFVHGILEEASLHDLNFGEHPGDACTDVPAASRASCFHGVGHALMFLTARDTATSVADCRSISNPGDASRCFEGVYMELFWGDTAHSGPNSLGWDLDHPLAPCVEAQADAKPACFIYSSFGYFRSHAKDYPGAINLCTQSTLADGDKHFCLKGVGIALTSHLHVQHVEQSESFAGKLSHDEKYAFYEGVMGYARFSGIQESALSATCALFQNDAAVCAEAVRDSK